MFAARNMQRKRSSLLSLRCRFGPIPLVLLSAEGSCMAESTCFATSPGDPLQSEMARGDPYEVAPGESDRLAAEVAAPHGGGLKALSTC
jgi:hypothetical protein